MAEPEELEIEKVMSRVREQSLGSNRAYYDALRRMMELLELELQAVKETL